MRPVEKIDVSPEIFLNCEPKLAQLPVLCLGERLVWLSLNEEVSGWWYGAGGTRILRFRKKSRKLIMVPVDRKTAHIEETCSRAQTDLFLCGSNKETPINEAEDIWGVRPLL